MDDRFHACDASRLVALIDFGSDDVVSNLTTTTQTHDTPRIEGYAISGVLGEGGMGVVWRAVQLSTHRPVALKLLPISQTQRARLRFDREVELAARLAHAHIARVYDSGATGGLSYYAMELVEGVHLDQYVSEHRLDQRATLRIMRDVCTAVHYAHQRGVIHRDLKPSNILVTPDGQPHVVDFGLAKAIEEDDSPALTRESQCPGTPGVMSPEQAAGRIEQIDTRTDVYSLGATLYLLLIGHFPHDLTGPRYQVMRRIADEDVRRPRDLRKNLPAELEWLLLKALAREPEQRYGSAEELARDIDRYLTGDALRASPQSTVYRLRKFVGKHRVWLCIAASFVLLLTAAAAISTWQAVRATRATAEAKHNAAEAARQETNARREAETQQAINQFLNDIFASANPFSRTAVDPLNGQNITVVEAIDSAVRKLDAGALNRQPVVELAVRKTIADTYMKVGQWGPAEVQLRAAIRLSREAHGDVHASVADCTHQLAIFLLSRGRLKDAESQAQDALAMFRRVGAPNPEVASSMVTVCDALARQNRFDEACDLARECVALAPLDGLAHVTLAEILMAQDKMSEAEPIFQQSLRISREKLAHPAGPRGTAGLAAFLRVINAFKNQGRYVEAEALCREVLPIVRKRLGETSMDVLVFNVRLGEALRDQGRLAEAEAEFRQAQSISHANGGRGNSMDRVVSILEQQGKLPELEQFYEQQIAFERKMDREGGILVVTQTKFATFLKSIGKLSDAESQWREVVALRRKRTGEESLELEAALGHLGEVLRDQGRRDESDALWREQLQYWQNQLGKAESSSRRAEIQLRMFWPLMNSNRREDARRLCREALELGPPPEAVTALKNYAWSLATDKIIEYREPELAVAMAEKASKLKRNDPAVWFTLGAVRYHVGQFSQAVAALQKSIELNPRAGSREYFFLAMAQHRVGEQESARRSYDTGIQRMPRAFSPKPDYAAVRAEAEETLFGKRRAAASQPSVISSHP